MEKILAPADKVLSEIGRFILSRPRFSIVLFLSALLLTIINNAFFDNANTTELTNHYVLTQPIPVATPIIAPQVATTPTAPITTATTTTTPTTPSEIVNDTWQVEKVRAGDNLSKILKRNHISAKDLMALTSLSGAKALRHLQIGEEIRLLVNENHRLQQLIYTDENQKTLSITADNGTLQISKSTQNTTAPSVKSISPTLITPASTPVKPAVNLPAIPTPVAAIVLPALPIPTKVLANASVSSAKAVITPSTVTEVKVNAKIPAPVVQQPTIAYVSGLINNKPLQVEAKKLGLTARQANQLVQIFSAKGIAKNLSAGDRFKVLYQTASTTTKKKNSGNILAAQLIHKGKSYQLVRFTDPKGRVAYYTPQGESLQGESISRAPVNYSHISSGFSTHRFDPVLRFVRPHVGVDYAAPYGTPIKAAGDGVIMLAGYKGGYGNTIVIKHDDKYSTLYAHLSKFAANLKDGAAVQQGQIIGYVGRTGFATGPHLHYEIHVNNKPANPITVALPGVKVPKVYRNLFFAQSKTLLAQLNTNKQVRLAERNDQDPVKKS